jgi:small subunit ribosomal protein S16
MSVKIRLQRHGRKKKPFYHIVASDVRKKRDGRFLEKIGYYNPLTPSFTFNLDEKKLQYWAAKGARTTNAVNKIIKASKRT